jgi:hypothetical protein
MPWFYLVVTWNILNGGFFSTAVHFLFWHCVLLYCEGCMKAFIIYWISRVQRQHLIFNPLLHGGSYMAQSDFFYFWRSVNVGNLAIYSGQVVCLLIKVFGGRFCHLETLLRSQGACFVLPSWWSGLYGLLTFHLRISAIYSVHQSKKN